MSPNSHEVRSTDLFQARSERQRDRVLELAGEYDVSCDGALRAALEDHLPGPYGLLVVDLSKVTFLDARCTTILLNAATRAPLVVVGASGIVARILDVLDPDQHLRRRRTRPGQASPRIN